MVLTITSQQREMCVSLLNSNLLLLLFPSFHCLNGVCACVCVTLGRRPSVLLHTKTAASTKPRRDQLLFAYFGATDRTSVLWCKSAYLLRKMRTGWQVCLIINHQSDNQIFGYKITSVIAHCRRESSRFLQHRTTHNSPVWNTQSFPPGWEEPNQVWLHSLTCALRKKWEPFIGSSSATLTYDINNFFKIESTETGLETHFHSCWGIKHSHSSIQNTQSSLDFQSKIHMA